MTNLSVGVWTNSSIQKNRRDKDKHPSGDKKREWFNDNKRSGDVQSERPVATWKKHLSAGFKTLMWREVCRQGGKAWVDLRCGNAVLSHCVQKRNVLAIQELGLLDPCFNEC